MKCTAQFSDPTRTEIATVKFTPGEKFAAMNKAASRLVGRRVMVTDSSYYPDGRIATQVWGCGKASSVIFTISVN